MILEAKYELHIGWDWGHSESALYIRQPYGQTGELLTLPTDAGALHAWATDYQERYGPRKVAVGIERLDGVCVLVLQQYACFEIYQFNPRAVSSFRISRSVANAKSDRGDAMLLSLMLDTHLDVARRHKRPSEEIRRLQRYTYHRRKQIEARLDLQKQLAEILRVTHPFMQKLFDVAALQRPIVLDLLHRWPNLTALQRVRTKTLRAFFYRHNIRKKERVDTLIDAIQQAVHISRDLVQLEILEIELRALIKHIRLANTTVQHAEAAIEAVWATYRERAFFEELPGAGKALAPRLAALFGDDRTQWESAAGFLAYSGIAPVQRSSGSKNDPTKRTTHFRRAAPKFLRQTLHEFARCSIGKSQWAGAFYRMKCQEGMRPQAAIRALAFKWGRILFTAWKNQKNYDEARYLNSLIKRGSPLIKYMSPCE